MNAPCEDVTLPSSSDLIAGYAVHDYLMSVNDLLLSDLVPKLKRSEL